MRIVAYRQGSGRASETARGNLNELVMLIEAAVALANVERWVQDGNHYRSCQSWRLTLD